MYMVMVLIPQSTRLGFDQFPEFQKPVNKFGQPAECSYPVSVPSAGYYSHSWNPTTIQHCPADNQQLWLDVQVYIRTEKLRWLCCERTCCASWCVSSQLPDIGGNYGQFRIPDVLLQQRYIQMIVNDLD